MCLMIESRVRLYRKPPEKWYAGQLKIREIENFENLRSDNAVFRQIICISFSKCRIYHDRFRIHQFVLLCEGCVNNIHFILSVSSSRSCLIRTFSLIVNKWKADNNQIAIKTMYFHLFVDLVRWRVISLLVSNKFCSTLLPLSAGNKEKKNI